MNRLGLLGLVSWVILISSLGFVPASQAQLTDEIVLVPLIDVKFSGWEKKTGFPKIEKGQEGDKGWIEAQNIYQKGGSTLTAVIAEGGDVNKDLAAMRALPEYDNKVGFRKKIVIGGVQGVESYDRGQKKGTLVLNVSNRFGIRLEAAPIENNEVLKDFANKMPLTKIWRLAQ
ncbi:MAG: hypothetical protein FJ126_10250 [Deltaproteobacteria bacterium]|nr:hypothetical protein [Deltaproteobacteria bacterium]